MKIKPLMSLACRLCRTCLNAFASGELDETKRLPVERHLQRCADCRAELADLRRIADRLTAYASANSAAVPSADLWSRIEAEIVPLPIRPTPAFPTPIRPIWQRPAIFWSGGMIAAASVGLLFFLRSSGSSVVALSANNLSTSKAIVAAKSATVIAASESVTSGFAASAIRPIVVLPTKPASVRVANVSRRRKAVIRLSENRTVNDRRRNRPAKTILLAANRVVKTPTLVKPTAVRIAMNTPKATETVMTVSESRPTAETSDFVTVANSDEPRAAQSNSAGAAVMVASRQMGLFSNLTR